MQSGANSKQPSVTEVQIAFRFWILIVLSLAGFLLAAVLSGKKWFRIKSSAGLAEAIRNRSGQMPTAPILIRSILPLVTVGTGV